MEILGIFVLVVFCLAIYFLPSIVGWGKQNDVAIFVLNLFLGWTVLGWIIALVWACCNDSKPKIYIENTKSEKNIYSELGKLAELHDKGIITDSEYLRLKQRLIGLTQQEFNKLKEEENDT